MNFEGKILPDNLSENEAWSLFKTVANVDDNLPFTDLAKMVARELGNSPVGIVSVGKSLRGKSYDEWGRALRKLQDGEIADKNIQKDLYKCLNFSFDELPGEATKRILLLCSLFPQDYEICVEDLARYAHGLGFYQHAQSIEEAMAQVLDAIHQLQDVNLLLDAESKGHVKMLSSVREVIRSIGKNYSVVTESGTKEEFAIAGSTGVDEWPKDGRFRECAAIFLLENEIGRLPDRLDCPRLEMLCLSRRALSPEGYTNFHQDYTSIADKTFEGMEKLHVLSVTRGILSLQSLRILTNLRTLELRYCKFASGDNGHFNLGLLKHLNKLEILSFYGSAIMELPDEMGELENLKLLELTNCYGLDIVSSNMIRKLSKLEELQIGCFEEWDERAGNARLIDITYLPCLAILAMTYRKKIPKDFSFSNLVGYHIHICDFEYPRFKSRLRHPMARTICIIPTEGIVSACKNLFNNVYNLRLECNDKNFRNLMPDMSPTGFQELSRLVIYGCEMECVISSSMLENTESNCFSNLAELEIGVTNLTEICEGQPPHGFLENLQRVTIHSCDQMMTIFPPKLFQGMKKLESVMIEDCEILQEVFNLEEFDEPNMECLSLLTKLELHSLDSLTSIWKGPSNLFNLQSLTHLTIYYCKSLKYIFSASLAQGLVHLKEIDLDDCDELEFIIAENEGQKAISETCSQQLCLQNLNTLKIEKCDRLKYVFPVALARGLPNLTEIYIKSSNQVLSLCGTEAEADTGVELGEIVFSKMLNIYMEDLPSLVGFCPRGYNFVFSSLQKLTVKECPQMTTSFTAAPDASVRAMPEPKAQTVEEDAETRKGTTQIMFGPSSAHNFSVWICCEGKWTPNTDSPKTQ